jgi:hypothetical protein
LVSNTKQTAALSSIVFGRIRQWLGLHHREALIVIKQFDFSSGDIHLVLERVRSLSLIRV